MSRLRQAKFGRLSWPWFPVSFSKLNFKDNLDEFVQIDQGAQPASASRPTSASNTGESLGKKTFWRSRPVAFGGVLALLIALFSPNLFLLFTTVFQSDLNSYIVLVPFVVGYLLFLKRKELPQLYDSAVIWAVPPLLLGAAALAVVAVWKPNGVPFSLNDHLALVTLAFVCLVWAGAFLFLGETWMKAAAFPVAFLLFLVPLPDRVVDCLETSSKLASAEAANLFFGMSGMPALRDGTTFQLPGFAIQVAQECSGIKSSWVLFITGLVAAHLLLTRTWSRALLVAAIIPLGILRNGFRIMVIGLLCVRVSPDMINSVLHRRGGPLFFALSLVPLWLLLWVLRSREHSARRGKNMQPRQT